MEKLKITDLRCPICSSEELLRNENTEQALIQCEKCGSKFEDVWGVPFLGCYERTEILGLIEILANLENRGSFNLDQAAVERWEVLLKEYHESSDREAYLTRIDPNLLPFFPNRYGEWQEVNCLSSGFSFADTDVLDLGAGLGFDAHRLALRGANVTALEFSPLLAESGARNFPNLRWIGGLCDVLPFKSASFDFVFCNAALHHFRDIPSAISESLRVLRPGGFLITTCDSFGPDTLSAFEEAVIFDREPAVLSGVNERVPRFNEFVSELEKYKKHLRIEIYTHTLYNAPLFNGENGTLTELTRWNLEHDASMLSQRSGSLALRVQLEEGLGLPARRASGPVLWPAEFVRSLDDHGLAITRLAPLMPDCYVNLPFPGIPGEYSKFELLNGWRIPSQVSNSRRGYRRARWYFQRKPWQTKLYFEARRPQDQKECKLKVFINGCDVFETSISSDYWREFEVDINDLSCGKTFVVELRVDTTETDLDAAGFDIKNRKMKIGNLLALLQAFMRSHIYPR